MGKHSEDKCDNHCPGTIYDEEGVECSCTCHSLAEPKPKTSWTPGPWRIGSRLESDNTLEICNGTKESPLAYVSPRAFYDDTQVANARLISLAPRMVEVLRAVDEWHDLIKQDYPEMYRVFGQARDLLAKLDGKGE